MRFNDAIIGAVLIIFALAEMEHTLSFPTLQGQKYGPDLFPILIGCGLFICGLVLVARGVKAWKTTPAFTAGEWFGDGRLMLNLFLLIAGVIIYIYFSEAIGFIPLSLVIMTVLMVRLGARPLPGIVISFVMTFAIHAMFAKVLLVPLPWGILLPVAW